MSVSKRQKLKLKEKIDAIWWEMEDRWVGGERMGVREKGLGGGEECLLSTSSIGVDVKLI